MKTHIHHLGSAAIAISAVLVLSSTPVAAQLTPAEPYTGAATTTTAPPPATTGAPIVGPVEGMAQPSAPGIAAEPPPIAPVPVAEQPVTAEVDASEPATPAAAAAPARRAAASPAPAPEAAPAPPDRASEAAPAAPEATADEPAAAEFAPVAIAPDTVLIASDAPPAPQPVDRSGEAILAGLVAALGLGALGWAAFALRRRRNIAAKKQQFHVTRASAEPKAAPVAAAAPAAPAAPKAPSDIRDWQRPAAEAGVTRAAGRPVSHGGAAVALPTSEPATFAERDALLRRMVAAPRDRANPFRAPKARLRRARLIVQSLGHKFQNGRSWIDLSQYPNNWPELRPSYPAAA